MSNRAETMPWIHRVNVEQAMQGLDYGDMVRLAVAFHDWAFNEVGIDGDQRTRLLMLSVDYERIAEFCGPAWTASDPSSEEDLIAFVARVLREERRPTIRSSTGEGSATSNEVHGEPAAPPSASEFLDSFASCMETIILEDDNPEDLMNEIMRHAERAGIIDATGAIRESFDHHPINRSFVMVADVGFPI